MKPFLVVVLALSMLVAISAHNFGTNPPTWNREISRLVFDRCASCHREGGGAFSLMTYQEAQPRAVAIKEAVLARRMPPWGAVKGFGEFQDDQGLTQEQVELFSDWVEGGMLRGNNRNVHPEPPKFEPPDQSKSPVASGVVVQGTLALDRPLVLAGLLADDVPGGISMQVVATLPDGHIQPLVWFYEYQNRYRHPFVFRRPMRLPAGTIIRGVRPPARIQLLQERG
jgi:hypothetical protein